MLSLPSPRARRVRAWGVGAGGGGAESEDKTWGPRERALPGCIVSNWRIHCQATKGRRAGAARPVSRARARAVSAAGREIGAAPATGVAGGRWLRKFLASTFEGSSL